MLITSGITYSAAHREQGPQSIRFTQYFHGSVKARTRKWEDFKKLIESEPSLINARNSSSGFFHGNTPLMYFLHLAIMFKDSPTARNKALEKIDYLLTHDADVNLKAPLETPLQTAIAAEDLELVKLLVEKNANIDQETIAIALNHKPEDLKNYLEILGYLDKKSKGKVKEQSLALQAKFKTTK
jgi:ankyrin repeat protein